MVAALLMLLFFLLWASPPRQLQNVLTVNIPKTQAFPLFYMRDMKTTQHAVDGRPAYQLQTVKFDYYAGRGSTAAERQASGYAILEKPLLIFYGDQTSVWHLSAASGESRNDGELILLTGNVRLSQLQDGIITTELTTQSMTVKPKEAFVETRDTVVAKGVSGTMKATGVKSFINSNSIEFLSAVQGSYDRL